MVKQKNNINKSRPILLICMGLFNLGLLIILLLQGTDVALLNPKGQIAGEQYQLLMRSVSILLLIAVPTLAVFYYTAWKYRESNKTATYDTRTHHAKLLVFSIWAAPTIMMLLLASIMWPATHRLAPQKSIANGAETLKIQVVAMRWKWLFIYPEQNIAAVNFVQIPTGVPVQFELSADETPMSSFWIPHLAGQLYAMTGHVNHLNILTDTPGDYRGSTAEINGIGFAGMKFIARASSQAAFDQWVADTKRSGVALDTTQYEKLLEPTENNPASFYSAAEPGLYDKMLMKYNRAHSSHTEQP